MALSIEETHLNNGSHRSFDRFLSKDERRTNDGSNGGATTGGKYVYEAAPQRFVLNECEDLESGDEDRYVCKEIRCVKAKNYQYGALCKDKALHTDQQVAVWPSAFREHKWVNLLAAAAVVRKPRTSERSKPRKGQRMLQG